MAQTAEKREITAKTHQSNENQTVKWYSEDDLNNEIIKAYNNFKSSLQVEIKKNLNEKILVAKQTCEKIYHSLNNEKNIKCKKIYLRPNSLISFDAIVVIPERAFLSDAFNKAYELAFEVSQPYQKNDFNFDFNFMPATRSINNYALLADGYIFSYGLIKK